MEKKTKSIGSSLLIIILIAIILVSSVIGIWAWARYQSGMQGQAVVQVAKWNFKVSGDGEQTEQISFLMTRTDNNETVATGTIAPGTFGEIPIEIDVTGTETDLMYTISGSIVNMPRNLKLYFDAARTEEMSVIGQKFSKGNYLKVSDIGTGSKVITETIYWEWPFETGTEEDVIEANNIKDTEDMGKSMTIALTVEGKQLNGAPVLADLVQVGDYVNYDANSNGEQTFTVNDYTNIFTTNTPGAVLPENPLSGTISTAESFDSEAKSQWRVLSVDKTTGIVELIAVEPTVQKIQLNGINGYANGEIVLNTIGKIYDNGKGAILDSGRSINLNDIDKYSSFVKESYVDSNGIKYGDTNTFACKTPGNKNVDLTSDEMIKLTGSGENPTTVTQTYYTYNPETYFSNSKIFNLIFRKSNDVNSNKDGFALATRSVNLNLDYCSFRLNRVKNSKLTSTSVYTGRGYENNTECSVLPVISLQANIQTTGQNANGVWEIVVE